MLELSVTPRFTMFGTMDITVYVSSLVLVLVLASFGLLTTSAAFHRVVTDPCLKHRLVHVSGRLALWGLVLLMLALSCAVLLVLTVVLPPVMAGVLAVAVLCWLFGFWFWMPMRARGRSAVEAPPPADRRPMGVSPR
ncbi:DUF6328 family protein [Streptomyces sp. NPDC047315]|uniref:DUF6328 family protein n=1 Tax=Streptomyces sp. NPDC047315 TaxID=3155142 RepID=UPI0033D12FB6